MPFDLSKFKKKMPMKHKMMDEKDDKKKKKKMTSPSANFMKRFEASK